MIIHLQKRKKCGPSSETLFVRQSVTATHTSRLGSGKVSTGSHPLFIRRLIKRRDHVFRKMRKQGTVELKVLCKQLRREVQCQLQRAYWTYLNTTFEDANSEQATKNKLFWTYIKHQKSSKVGAAHWRKKDALFRTPKSRLKYSRGSSSRRTAKGGHSPKKSSMRSAVGPPSTSLQLTRSPLVYQVWENCSTTSARAKQLAQTTSALMSWKN